MHSKRSKAKDTELSQGKSTSVYSMTTDLIGSSTY